MSTYFTSFKEKVGAEVKSRRWLTAHGLPVLILALIAFVASGAVMFFVIAQRWRAVYPRWSDVVLLGLAFAAILNAVVVAGALTQRRLWHRRSSAGEGEAERWQAFRRYLTDFPRLQEAPPATIELWERFLVYGIAFGIADQVLQAAHILMPEELAQASSIYWISPGGNLGSGASSISIGDLSCRVRLRAGAHRHPAPVASAEASPAGAAEAAGVAEAGPGRARGLMCISRGRGAAPGTAPCCLVALAQAHRPGLRSPSHPSLAWNGPTTDA